MVGDVEKAFSRQGAEIHLSELRAGVLPLYATLPNAFVWGFLLSLFPWALINILQLILFIGSGGSAQEAPTADSVALWSALETAWPYGLALGAACVAGSLLRRYSARRNKYLVFMIGQFAEFRASYGEIATSIGIAASLLALSETARELNLLTVMIAPIIGMVVQDCQDFTLRAYARLAKNHVAESLYSVWELLRTREDARNARVNQVGAQYKGRVLLLNGIIPDQPTLDFLSRLPHLIDGVDKIIVNGQELRSKVPLRPTHAQQ